MMSDENALELLGEDNAIIELTPQQKTSLWVALMNRNPPNEWLKKHEFIKDYYYLPIGRVEWLLRRFTINPCCEVMSASTMFNAVSVCARVTYTNPVTGEREHQDGVGAWQVQTKKGASPADMANINNNAVGMAYPAAYSEAIKNACQKIGVIFGGRVNDEVDWSLSDTALAAIEERKSKVVAAKRKGAASGDDNQG